MHHLLIKDGIFVVLKTVIQDGAWVYNKHVNSKLDNMLFFFVLFEEANDRIACRDVERGSFSDAIFSNDVPR